MRQLSAFPKVTLGVFPTPIQKLDNISKLLHTNVFIKRDDLTGLGLGGNKVRKLEYLLADAKEKGAEVVFTTGGAQSNHAMLTAAAAGKMGMKPILILKKRGVTERLGNQLLEHLMGTEVVFMDTDDYADIYAEMDRMGCQLGVPYYKIPCGGSNALGALGYVDCAREIGEQGIHFDHIVCAEGSGGTMAGMALGAKLFLPGTKVHGMMVDTDPFDQITPALMREAAALGDIFVTVTGCEDVIGPEDFLCMKDGAICCNAGHFDVEVAVAKLKAMAVSHRPARNNIEAYTLENGKTIYIIAEGRLVNLAAGDGHPAEIMDMSFAIQALSAQYLVQNRGTLTQKLNNVPAQVDREVALRKLKDWGIHIDTLTPAQHKYIFG